MNVLVLTALLQDLDKVVPQTLLGCFGSLVCWKVNLCLVWGPESSMLMLLHLAQPLAVCLSQPAPPSSGQRIFWLGGGHKAHQLGVAVMADSRWWRWFFRRWSFTCHSKTSEYYKKILRSTKVRGSFLIRETLTSKGTDQTAAHSFTCFAAIENNFKYLKKKIFETEKTLLPGFRCTSHLPVGLCSLHWAWFNFYQTTFLCRCFQRIYSQQRNPRSSCYETQYPGQRSWRTHGG